MLNFKIPDHGWNEPEKKRHPLEDPAVLRRGARLADQFRGEWLAHFGEAALSDRATRFLSEAMNAALHQSEHEDRSYLAEMVRKLETEVGTPVAVQITAAALGTVLDLFQSAMAQADQRPGSINIDVGPDGHLTVSRNEEEDHPHGGDDSQPA